MVYADVKTMYDLFGILKTSQAFKFLDVLDFFGCQ